MLSCSRKEFQESDSYKITVYSATGSECEITDT